MGVLVGVLTSHLAPQVGHFAFLQVISANAPPFSGVGGGWFTTTSALLPKYFSKDIERVVR